MESTLLIQNAFPTLPNGFYDVLYDMIKDEGFTDQRLKDSVKHVIKNCVYPQPTVAQFISFDKKIDLFTYDDMMKKTDTDKDAFKRFLPIKLPGVSYTLWAHKNDVEKYNLEVKR